MRRVLALIVCVCTPTFGAWDKGFDFRATAGFVTDPANTTYVIETEAYPTVRNSSTFGWNSTTCLNPDGGGGSRDRDSGIDARIAGINFIGNTNTPCTFRVDLPAAGTYKIQLGAGDAGGNAQTNYIDVRDNTTNVISLRPCNSAATPTFCDANGSTYNAATWPGSEVTITANFATTTLNLVLGDASAGSGTNSVISHLFISQVVQASTPTITILPGTSGTVTFLGGSGGTVTSR